MKNDDLTSLNLNRDGLIIRGPGRGVDRDEVTSPCLPVNQISLSER